jgi:hypothetical protein
VTGLVLPSFWRRRDGSRRVQEGRGLGLGFETPTDEVGG